MPGPSLAANGHHVISPPQLASLPRTSSSRGRLVRSHSSPSRPSGPFEALPHQLLPLSFIPPTSTTSNRPKMPSSPLAPEPTHSSLSASSVPTVCQNIKQRLTSRPALQTRQTTAGDLLPATTRSRSSTISLSPNPLEPTCSKLSSHSSPSAASTDAPIPPSLAAKGWTDHHTTNTSLDPASRTTRQEKRRSLTRLVFPSSPPSSLSRTNSRASASSRHTSQAPIRAPEPTAHSSSSSVISSWLSNVSISASLASPVPFSAPAHHHSEPTPVLHTHPGSIPSSLNLSAQRRNLSGTSGSSGDGQSIPPETDVYEHHLLPSPVFMKEEQGEWQTRLMDALHSGKDEGVEGGAGEEAGEMGVVQA